MKKYFILNKKGKSLSGKYIFFSAFFFCLSLFSCSSTVELEIAEKEKDPVKVEITSDSTIVCFGDSLTHGHGADIETESWPALLQKRINIPVINAGIDDNTTEDAVERFDEDVLSHNPAMIIFDFGGNDKFLMNKHQTNKEIEENFRTMLDKIDYSKTQVYIMRFFNDEMRFFDLWGNFDRILKRLEKDYNVIIIWDAWKNAWGKSDCKADMTHCNAKGYEVMEQNIFEVIEPFLIKNNLLIE